MVSVRKKSSISKSFIRVNVKINDKTGFLLCILKDLNYFRSF